MKKIFALMIAVVLCFSLVSVVASAEGEAVIAIGSVTGAPGETVNVPVTLSGNPGIWGVKFQVKYDNANLELVAADPATSEVYTASEILCSPLTNEIFTFTGEYTDLASNNEKNGTLIVLQFKIKAEAEEKDYAVDFTGYDADNFFNCAFEDVAVTCTNGVVTASVPKLYPAPTATSANLTIADVKGDAGSTVLVPITLANNTGVWGVKFQVGYDKNVLELVSADPASGTVYASSEILCSPLTNDVFTFTGEYTDLASNNTKNGVVIVLEFKISATAANGTYPVTFAGDYDADNYFNCEFTDVEFGFVNGSVSVPGETETTAEEITTTTTTTTTTTIVDDTTTTTIVDDTTTAAVIDTPDTIDVIDDTTAAAPVATTAGSSTSPKTGSTAPIATLVLAAAAAFVVVKARKK